MHGLSTSLLVFLHSEFMLSVMKMLLKGEVGDRALNSHGNYIVDRGKSWTNHGIVSLNFHGNWGYTNIVKLDDMNKALLSSIYLKKSTIFILIFRYVVLC